jgi:hypothetical protein
MRRLILTLAWAAALFFSAPAGAAEPADYTGFWKYQCSDSFGYAIKPYKDGLYSVSLCQPGGCARFDPASLTTIEGDPRYKVVSPTEIIDSRDYSPLYNDYSALHKCTTDTNPHLERSRAEIAENWHGFLFLLAHVIYLAAAIVLYRWMRRRLRAATALRLRLLRSAILAILFAPGVAVVWQLAMPTFALWAFVAVFLPNLFSWSGFILASFLLSVGPMIVVWLLIFFFSTALAAIRAGQARV